MKKILFILVGLTIFYIGSYSLYHPTLKFGVVTIKPTSSSALDLVIMLFVQLRTWMEL